MDDIDALNILETEVGLDAPIDPLDDIPFEDDAPRYNPEQMLDSIAVVGMPKKACSL